MKLEDKIAVVTGAAGGIGAAICEAFAREGAIVAVTDLSIETAEATAVRIRETGGRAEALAFDVSDHAAVEDGAEKIETRLGPIDIWVNNAGISHITAFLDCSEKLWDSTININLKGTFNGSQAAIKRMAGRKRGVIINMASQSGKKGASHYAAYCASKFGIIGLTQSLALEFASVGIRINALCPGVVFTPLWEEMLEDYAAKRKMKPEDVRPYMERRIPLGRLCTPEDIARAAVFIASDDASYMTGQAINITGGAIMH